MSIAHLSAEPAILYLGTPVVLVSSTNEDGAPNLAPMSSASWLRWRCMLGFEAISKTPGNIVRTGECVLKLPAIDQVHAGNRISMVTGSNRGQNPPRVSASCRQIWARRPHSRAF
jgi:flavin reductase (DIM6/NTAB) family NADH-FMN oxidoreductase RutF